MTEWKAISSDGDMKFNLETANQVCLNCNKATALLMAISENSRALNARPESGRFQSAINIQNAITALATVTMDALNSISTIMQDIGTAVRQAGLRIDTQDDDTRKQLENASSTSHDVDSKYTPLNSNGSALVCTPDDPFGPGSGHGAFPCATLAEASGGDVVQWGYDETKDAQPEQFQLLAEKWMAMSRDLSHIVTEFKQQIDAQFSHGEWTGTAADSIRSGLHSYIDTASKAAMDSHTNATTISKWATDLATTKSTFADLHARKQAANQILSNQPFTPSDLSHYVAITDKLNTEGSDHILRVYNPNAHTAATGLRNVSNPHNPVSPMAPPGAPHAGGNAGSPNTNGGNGLGVASGGMSGSGVNRSASGANGSASGGGTRGNASAPKNAGAAAHAGAPGSGSTPGGQPAPHQKSPTENASQGGASSGAASGAGTGASGAGSPGSTHSTGLTPSAVAPGDTRAGRNTATGRRISAGGGVGGGMAGAGSAGASGAGMGGAGSAGGIGGTPEPPLTPRPAPTAPTPASEALKATPSARPTTGPGGTPMGGRGAGAHAGNNHNKTHKTARYLRTTENGEEIVGELPELAPAVIGDTATDDDPDFDPNNPPRLNTSY